MNDGPNISSGAQPLQTEAQSSAPDFAAAVQPSYVRTVFLGSDGLRAGWGLAFYVAMFYPLQFVVSRWVGSLELGASGLWSMMLAEFGVLVAAMYGLRVFDVGHLAMHGARIVKFAVFWAMMFLLVGFFEEFLLRGYTQFTLTRVIGFWPSAVVLSCMFGLIHRQNRGEQWSGLLAVAAIGFFFCLTLRRTGSLWFAVGFHAAWDWGETFFYSVPDSGTVFPGHLLKSSFHGPRWLTGGSVGPEGSVLCFVVIAVAWVGFAKVYHEVKYRTG